MYIYLYIYIFQNAVLQNCVSRTISKSSTHRFLLQIQFFLKNEAIAFLKIPWPSDLNRLGTPRCQTSDFPCFGHSIQKPQMPGAEELPPTVGFASFASRHWQDPMAQVIMRETLGDNSSKSADNWHQFVGTLAGSKGLSIWDHIYRNSGVSCFLDRSTPEVLLNSVKFKLPNWAVSQLAVGRVTLVSAWHLSGKGARCRGPATGRPNGE